MANGLGYTNECALHPDGLAFDAEGGLWITSIVSNRVISVAPDGADSTSGARLIFNV